ncbi:Glutathione S-transferase [plant metagenome]
MYTLLIANKNYSSWSMRAWLALRATGVPFQERKLTLFSAEFSREVAGASPAGLVPVLLDEGFAVWDSLAICEYVAERHPQAGLWPAEARARARARSLASQMHSGFIQLRSALPMNIEANLPGIDFPQAAREDIARLQSLWLDTRREFGRSGPFLFGNFSAADAFYAPVVSRFQTYGITTSAPVQEYMDAVCGLPAFQQWCQEAREEGVFVPEDEPYRKQR